MCQLNEFNAFRQLDFRQVNCMADFQITQINFNELRQIFRQAADFCFVHGVCYQTAADLDARSNLFVDEVEWHLDVNLLGGADALKVDVLNGVANWVQLIVTQQYLLLLAFQIQRQDRSVKSFITELQEQCLVKMLFVNSWHP